MKPEFLILTKFRANTYTLVNRVFVQERTYYPDILFKHPFPETSVTLQSKTTNERVRALFQGTPPHLIFIFIPGTDNEGLHAYTAFKTDVLRYFETLQAKEKHLKTLLDTYQKSRRLTTSQSHRLLYEARLYTKRRELYPSLLPLADILCRLPVTRTVSERNAQFNALIDKLQCAEFFHRLY